MTLNPGCLKFFRSLLGTERVEVGVNVVSCCWSADVIASSFPKDGGYIIVITVQDVLTVGLVKFR
ncbi:hypothetical protein SAY87_005005 [Trapa incisa]|uniref:Uncharacterized protein n=1 Tax=Trapa incisa TaxID=236973 RepID=A0AAN7JVL2_9MYRT|nr:hypothetical protein SAY87_005005 [Trapa incisa]